MRARICFGIGVSICAAAALSMTAAIGTTVAATPEPAVSFAIAAAPPPELQSSYVNAVREAMRRARAGDPDEHEDPTAPPDGLVLEWADAPTSQSDIVRDSGLLTLRVMNLDTRTHTVQATVIGDGGTMQSRTRSQAITFSLPAGALQPLAIDTIATPFEPWQYAGAVIVHVRACSVDAPGTRCRVGVSDPLFFNPIGLGPQMQFYGERALMTAHGSGDLRGSAATMQPAGTMRVMGGGPLTVDPAVDGAVPGETVSGARR